MVKHIVSVCIFCFLCATHSPCASHAEVTHGGTQFHDNRIPFKEGNSNSNSNNNNNNNNNNNDNEFILDGATTTTTTTTNRLERRDDGAAFMGKWRANSFTNDYGDDYTTHNENDNDANALTNYNNDRKTNRIKKDINSASSNSLDSNSNNKLREDDYLEMIFNAYGDGKSLSLDAFQKLMRHLDVGNAINAQPRSSHSSHDHHQPEHDHEHNSHNHHEDNMCINHIKLYDALKNETTNSENGTIDGEMFKKACPAIIYSIIARNCSTTTNPNAIVNDDDEIGVPSSNDHNSDCNNRTYAWIWSALAILLISACGILGLAVIPVMQKKFYQPLLQFLVALAVGTLAGDALLHLLPHAMMTHSERDHNHRHEHNSNHDQVMWKGFVAMLGLIFFFLMERIVMLAAKWRKKQQLKDKLPTRLKVIKPEMSTQLTNAAEKQCKHKYSSFPYCYDEIKMDHEDRVFQVGEGAENWDTTHNHTNATILDDIGSHSDLNAFKLPHNNQNLEKNQNMTECPNDAMNTNCSEINKMLSSEINKMISDNNDTDSVEYTVILREHDNPHHGHSHTHGHVHAAPKTMSSVAWMVIMGDGLHNFTDGMAIGAAFAGSTAGGFSTAVAVFCHELPHELGDFAMLLKAGMSMKQALYYNMLSSILCLFGNIFGLWLGNTEYASSWVFAAAAGMFLYIALVDMIPELSSGHEAEGTLLQCMLHLGGLLLGFGVMTLIALYEHDLKTIFNE